MAMRILLVDDHAGFLAGLRTVLGEHQDMEIVGQARSGAEAIVEAYRLKPDVVLLDWNLPDLKGLQVLAILKKQPDAPRVVMLTMFQEHSRYRDSALAVGADGFVCKAELAERLLPLLRELHAETELRAAPSP